MAKIKLLLTCDYEVFGNGSGDIGKCMIEPTDRLLKLFGEYGARLTLFAEVCEMWAFGQSLPQQDNPEKKAQNQLIQAVTTGHDVQLHIHPQWFNYKHLDDGAWELDQAIWRTGLIAKEKGMPFLLEGLKKGKEYLENLLQPIDTSYRCSSFRAGALSIQPELEVLQALTKLGFKNDSSVAAGLSNHHHPTFFDFTSTDKITPYKMSSSVTEEDKAGHLVEYPILTTSMGMVEKIRFKLGRDKTLTERPCGCEGSSESLSNKNRPVKKSILSKLFSRQIRPLDFTGIVSSQEMMYMLKQAYQKVKNMPQETIPIVGIGHSKNLGNEKEIERFLAAVEKSSFVEIDRLEEKSLWR